MRFGSKGLITWLATLALYSGFADHASSSQTASPSKVVVNLVKIGWAPPSNVSDRAFFKDFSLDKLFAMDVNTRVVFLNEDIIIVYQTKQEGKDWHSASRVMEAFFIRPKDGSLLSTHRWPVGTRKSPDDLIDSEARLVPIGNSHFLVLTEGVIRLYGPKVDLLREKRLDEPSGPRDFWSAQSVLDGREIFLRHASTSSGVEYLWLAADTLEVEHKITCYQGRDYSIGGAIADKDAAFERSRMGIRMIDRDQRFKIICDDPLCRETGSFKMLSSGSIGWSGMSGIGIIDTVRGRLIWSKSVQPQYRGDAFEFGRMRSAMSGTNFAVWISANRRALFDEVEMSSLTILVYDTANLKKRPSVFHLKTVKSDWDFALSPNGTKLAFFDGTSVEIYSL
jgi:hypothetical protein